MESEIKHYKDVITGQTECGNSGKKVININEVSCMKCLELIKKEWERQVVNFKYQPLENAKVGLKETKRVIIKLLREELKQARFEMQHPLNKGTSDGDYWKNKIEELKSEIEEIQNE